MPAHFREVVNCLFMKLNNGESTQSLEFAELQDVHQQTPIFHHGPDELVPGIVPVHASLLVSNEANICQEQHENIVIRVPKKPAKS